MKAAGAPEFPAPPPFITAPGTQAFGGAPAKSQPKIEVCYTNSGHYIPKSSLMAARTSAANQTAQAPQAQTGAAKAPGDLGNTTPATSFQRQSTGPTQSPPPPVAGKGSSGPQQVQGAVHDGSSGFQRQMHHAIPGPQLYETDTGATGTVIFRKQDPNFSQLQKGPQQIPPESEAQSADQKLKKKKPKKTIPDPELVDYSQTEYYQDGGFGQHQGLGAPEQIDQQYYDPAYAQYDEYGYQIGYQEPEFGYSENQGFDNQEAYYDNQYQAWLDPNNFAADQQHPIPHENSKKRKGKTPNMARSELDMSNFVEPQMPQPMETGDDPSKLRRASESLKRKNAQSKDPLSKLVDLMSLHKKYENSVKSLTAELNSRGISLKILMKIDPQIFSANCASDIAKIQKHISSGDEAEDLKIKSLITNVHKRVKAAERELLRIRSSFLDKMHVNPAVQSAAFGGASLNQQGPLWNKPVTKGPKNPPSSSANMSPAGHLSMNWKNSAGPQDPSYPAMSVSGKSSASVSSSPIHIPLVAVNPKIGISSTVTTGNYGTYILKPSKVQKPGPAQPTASPNHRADGDNQTLPIPGGFSSEGHGGVMLGSGEYPQPSPNTSEQRKPSRLRLPDQNRVDMIAATMSDALLDISSGLSAPSAIGTGSLQDQNSVAEMVSEEPSHYDATQQDPSQQGFGSESFESHFESHQTSWTNSPSFLTSVGGFVPGFGISSHFAAAERGHIGKGGVNKTATDSQGQGRSSFNLFSKPAPSGGERSLLKRIQTKGSSQPSDSNRGADSVSDQLPLGANPQEQGQHSYYQSIYEGNITEVPDTIPQNPPSGNYPAGDGAATIYDAYPISPSAEAGYFSSQYNHRIASSKDSAAESYYPENYAPQANMQEVIGHGFGAIIPNDPQNAQFGNNMDRNSDLLDASEQQSAFEREPEDESIMEPVTQVPPETAQEPATYPDLPNTEPRHIEESDGSSHGLPAGQEVQPSGHPSVDDQNGNQEAPNPLEEGERSLSPRVEETTIQTSAKTIHDAALQERDLAVVGSHTPSNQSAQAGDSADHAHHPGEMAVKMNPQPQPSSLELQSVSIPTDEMSNNSRNNQVEQVSLAAENLRPTSQAPLSGNGSFTVRDLATAVETNSTILESVPVHQNPPTEVQPAERHSTPPKRDFGRDWTKDELSKIKHAGHKAAEAVRRVCSKAIEMANGKRQTKKGLEGMWSQISNPKRLALHQLCTDPDYSTSIQRWLNRAKEAEKVEFLYEIRPHLLHIVTNYIGKLLLHTLFTMSRFF